MASCEEDSELTSFHGHNESSAHMQQFLLQKPKGQLSDSHTLGKQEENHTELKLVGEAGTQSHCKMTPSVGPTMGGNSKSRAST